jgi:hypothetical protein
MLLVTLAALLLAWLLFRSLSRRGGGSALEQLTTGAGA